jgi:hypothetical protein
MFKAPKFLVTCVIAGGSVVIGSCANNAASTANRQQPKTGIVQQTVEAKQDESIRPEETASQREKGARGKPVSKRELKMPQRMLSVGMAAPAKMMAADACLALRPPHSSRYEQPEFNTEEYDRIHENQFVRVVDKPLSTFSIDVDAASYSNIRRFLSGGALPPKDAVRIEEMINYFSYEYPQPRNHQPFSITTELGQCPWNKNNQLVLIGLQGKSIDISDLPPNNLTFLIDVSGSMQDHNKLPLLKKALRLLVENLRDKDRVAVTVYAGAAGQVLEPTPGNRKSEILSAIDRLEAGGSTAGAEGIELAYSVASQNLSSKSNSRVILCTDGDFNVGASSDGELERLIEEKRKSGIYLTVLGFGMGNYKDSKMEKLADKGQRQLCLHRQSG